MSRITLAIALVVAGTMALLVAQARDPALAGPGGFDLFSFFEGEAASEGTITTLLVRREAFTATFAGTRHEGTFRLEERFAFEDGPRLQVWTLRAVDGGYEGTVETEKADGTLAPAAPVRGSADETGVVLRYRGIAPGGGRAFDFRHRMRLQGDGTLANHVVVSKFAIPLATSRVTFTRGARALPSSSPGR